MAFGDRRTPLGRGKPLARGGRIAPVSARRRGQTTARRAVVAEVVARDGRCVPAFRGAPGPCTGPLTAHEVVKRSQMRDAHLDPANCLASCWGHNSWIEDHPADARALGLVRSSWERTTTADEGEL